AATGGGGGLRVSGLSEFSLMGLHAMTALEGGGHRGSPGTSGGRFLGQEAGRGACEKAETAGS
ncbi:hypothetical protein D7V88_33895, partial [Corallococcus terminator]